jgi:hypothetical protein
MKKYNLYGTWDISNKYWNNIIYDCNINFNKLMDDNKKNKIINTNNKTSKKNKSNKKIKNKVLSG